MLSVFKCVLCPVLCPVLGRFGGWFVPNLAKVFFVVSALVLGSENDRIVHLRMKKQLRRMLFKLTHVPPFSCPTCFFMFFFDIWCFRIMQNFGRADAAENIWAVAGQHSAWNLSKPSQSCGGSEWGSGRMPSACMKIQILMSSKWHRIWQARSSQMWRQRIRQVL